MKHFDLLETKRKHVKTYSDKVPEKELIERSLWKAWKTSPSKNNGNGISGTCVGTRKRNT